MVEKNTNNEVLDLVKEKRSLISILRSRQWHMIDCVLRHYDKLQNIILKGMIEGTCYISLIIKIARVDSYNHLKDIARDNHEENIYCRLD